uniref:ATP synthase F0 subunit 8 n=1 Tax=Melanastera paucipunctata TaxID=2218046 RepID=A0A344A295_9HEMI|nr:ATP synthase F0 subunit 8 [Diclidophlebia paucipunctata]AWU48886.1 ATP synthase F0 subunit 8 [Diclidophlebia paucipunctata]
MPQMAPMLWPLISLITFISLMIITSHIYFMNNVKMALNQPIKPKFKMLKW